MEMHSKLGLKVLFFRGGFRVWFFRIVHPRVCQKSTFQADIIVDQTFIGHRIAKNGHIEQLKLETLGFPN